LKRLIFSLSLFFALAAFGPATAVLAEVEPSTPLSVIAAAHECGLPAENISSREDDDLQDTLYFVKVGPNGKYRKEALCLAYWNTIVSSSIKFDDQVVKIRQRETEERQAKFFSKISSESWLGGAGLYDAKRPFDPANETISDYLSYIERSCKAEPGALLKSKEPKLVTFETSSLAKMDVNIIWSISCANSLMAFSGIEKHGYSFGLVGWTVAATDEQK
jgi:hypothetical protein